MHLLLSLGKFVRESTICLIPRLNSALDLDFLVEDLHGSEELGELPVLSHSFWEAVLRVVHLLVPLVLEEDVSEVAGLGVFKDLLDGDVVLLSLGHLLAIDVELSSMPEVVDPIVTLVVCLGLGKLIVVVREPQVDSTTVDIDWPLLEDGGGHR